MTGAKWLGFCKFIWWKQRVEEVLMEEIIQEALNKGVEMHVAGEFDLAGKLYETVIKLQRNHADANHNMGLLKLDTGNNLEALPYLQTALQADTSIAQFWLSYLKVLINLERLDEAGRILDLAKESGIENEEFVELTQLINTATEIKTVSEREVDTPSQSKPNILDSLKLNQALRLAEKKAKEGDTEEALRIYLDILAKFPKNKQAQQGLANLNKPKKSAAKQGAPQEQINQLVNLYNQGQLAAVVEKANILTAQYPDLFLVWNILGAANKGLGLVEAASEAFKKVTDLNPTYPDGFSNLGVILQEQGKLDEAIASYNKALSLKPDYAEAYNNMGNALKDQGKLDEAIEAFNKALSLKPDYAEAYNNMGNALQDQGKLEEAIASYNKALSLKPDYAEVFSNLFFCLDSTIYENPRLYRDVVVAFNEFTSSKVKQKLQRKNYSGSQKIRLGFVSGDLNDHPVGYFLETLFKHIHKDTFELFAYYNARKSSKQTHKLRQFTTDWRVIAGVPDDITAKVIHKDDIDVLIDLSGHTALNRLPVFSYRPCALQASWLGYFGSTWLNEIDFIIGDRFVTPADRHNLFSEKIALLKNSYLCFAPPNFEIPISETPALKNNHITFGCFNNSAKINNDVILTWSKILREVENSILFFKGRSYENLAKKRLIKEFQKNNIDRNRLIFEGKCSRLELLESYNEVDIALDPFPYPGGTTTCEALWMGVPTVTQKGNSFISSVGETIAINSGHSELCTANLQDYVALAIKLASDFDLLNNRRIQRREKVMDTPIFDGQLFAQDFERLIFGMLEEMGSDE